MICSTNKTARDAAEATIRESGLLEKHQGFGLGAATLPLEHPTPVRRLSPDGQGDSVSAGSGTSHDTIASSQQISPFLENLPFYPRQYPPSDSSTPDASSPLIVNALISSAGSSIPDTSTVVYATSTHPRLGRRIFSPTKDGQISQHYATAGIIIKVGEDYFQLTAGHLFEGESEISDENQSLMSLDECHFDGQSSDEHDSDYESEITGRGSATPEDAQSGNESTSDSTNGKTNDGCTIDMRRNSNQETNMLHQWPTNIFPPHQTQEPIGSSSVVRTNSANLNIKFPIGHLPPGRPIRPTIDYAMISLSSDSVNIMGKDIDPYEFSHPPVKAVAEVGREECSIIVVTSSAIIRGTLIPGKVAYRGPPLHQFDKLVQIILELELFEGDCGSPVLDKSSGSLYGHIVMGIAGTRIAYIVQAVDIFQDIVTKTGKPVSIVIGKDVTEMTVPLADSYVPASQHPSRSEGLESMVIYCSKTNPTQLGVRFLPLASMDEAITAEINMTERYKFWYRPFKGRHWHSLVEKARYNHQGEQVTRVLGVLGLCDQEKAARDLLRDGLTDADLPLEKSRDFGTLLSPRGKRFKFFSKWTGGEIDYLLSRQSEVLAPMFTVRGEHISIDGRVPLPVYNIEDLGNARTIYKAQLHASHLMPKAKNDPQVAIKCFKLWLDFEKEKQNLVTLQKLNHPHLIRHLATVQHGSMYYTILYLADGGNLYDFWERNPDAFLIQDPIMFNWCFQQMLGLVDALFVLHGTNCRHGDLSPENIFHFQNSDDPDIPQDERGRFVIADIGTSKLHHLATDPPLRETVIKASALCYQAPEAQLDEGKSRSLRCDIWSVGCIFMDFVIWFLYGHKTIDVFREIRRGHDHKAAYYKCIGGHMEFHPAVYEGLEALRNDSRCAKGTGLADLIDLIAHKLIVIEPQRRATAEELKDEFKKILQKVDQGFSIKMIEPRPLVPNAFTLK
ncbi:hypothetical protein GQX73_g8955 [Xylaria multiplex]|uniref:Protein kinase domain-containing protein n=1 Tax=Xylaria multiplex TaxID=323545 RepID=A0A7C8IIP9_9PEZI|nr:hypothetical protein GQX73_g8955 [Xylaria multiplex]